MTAYISFVKLKNIFNDFFLFYSKKWMIFLWFFIIFHVLFRILNNVLLHYIKRIFMFWWIFQDFSCFIQNLEWCFITFYYQIFMFYQWFWSIFQFFSSYFTTKSWSDLILFCSNLFFNSLSRIFKHLLCLIISMLFQYGKTFIRHFRLWLHFSCFTQGF